MFSPFLSPLTKPKVELSNGNWKEIERFEVNLMDNERPNLVEEIEENNGAIEKTNGDIITQEVNGESKVLKEEGGSLKVWLLFLINMYTITHFCMRVLLNLVTIHFGSVKKLLYKQELMFQYYLTLTELLQKKSGETSVQLSIFFYLHS